jgi:clan AA aspartic protease (TIGR02281 family)
MTDRPTLRGLSALTSAWFFFILLLAAPVHSAVGEVIQLERQHGAYMVPVRINEAVTLPFILDTGAAEVAIPQDVFSTLIRTGTVKETDFVGTGRYVLADGSEQSSDRFILHQLRIGSHVVRDVVANVVPVKGDPLLGQSFLAKLPAWAIDNERHALVLYDNPGTTKRIENQNALFIGQCRYQIVIGFFPCDDRVAYSVLQNGRSLLFFTVKGETLITLSGGRDRQPNLENYFLSIDTIHMERPNRGDGEEYEDHGIEGECHFRLNRAATKFFEIKCDVYNRSKGTTYSFYLEKIRKFDRTVF